MKKKWFTIIPVTLLIAVTLLMTARTFRCPGRNDATHLQRLLPADPRPSQGGRGLGAGRSKRGPTARSRSTSWPAGR